MFVLKPHSPSRWTTALQQPFLNQTPYANFLIFIHAFRSAPVKPEATWVQVPSVELDDSQPKTISRMKPRGWIYKQRYWLNQQAITKVKSIQWASKRVERRKLKLNEEKTRIVDFNQESFEFLGFRISPRKSPRGKQYPHVEPSPKSCKKMREAIRQETARCTLWKESGEVFTRVNRRVRGWSNYFHYGNSTKAFSKMQCYTQNQMRRWLWKKHAKTHGQYTQAYSNERLHENYHLYNLPLYAAWKHSWSNLTNSPPRAVCWKSARTVRWGVEENDHWLSASNRSSSAYSTYLMEVVYERTCKIK